MTNGSGNQRKESGDEGKRKGRATALHAPCVGEEAGARNRAFCRVRWLQPATKATSCVRMRAAVAVWIVSRGNRFLVLCVLQRVVAHACAVLCAW